MFYSKKGFTVAEILITIVLVTVVVGPILSSYMVGLKSTEISEKDFNMDTLAQELMSEIMEKNYEDMEFYGNIGREQDEISRIDFDDVDDYNGYVEEYGEIKDISGSVNDQYSEYRRQVDIFNENREPISSDDGLEYEHEAIPAFGFETIDIKISRDGNRLFGINKTESTLFCANPFSEEIEADISLDEVPLNMELSPDSLKIYLNYGYKIEVYSYNPGEFNFSYELKGIDFNTINDIDIFEGDLVIATDKGIYSKGDLLNNISPVDFVYNKFDKTVLVSGRTIYVYSDSQLNTSITSANIAEGRKVTSAFYDEYQNNIYVSTDGDYIWIYDFDLDSWQQKISTFSKESQKIMYLYVDGEYYFGGEDNESQGLFKSNLGDINRIQQISATIVVKDLKFDKENGVIWILGKHLHKLDISTGNIIEKVWLNNDNRNNISFKILDNNMYILSDKGILKINKNTETVVYDYSFENITDFVLDNQKIYFSDSSNIYSINTDFTELETMNLFGDISKLIVSKDGKTIYMPSSSRDTIFYLDPFTNVISSVDVPCHDLIQSSSGNTLWSPGDSKFYRIQNSSIEEISVDNNYSNLFNIDKSDQFFAFDPSEGSLDMYSYRDAFKDSFDFFSGYNFTSYFTSGNKGFNVKNLDSKVIVDTKSAVDADHNDNIGSIIFYKTFVFPIPKYLNTLQVLSDHEFSGGKLEMFCYSGKINKESFDQKNGDISDADAIFEITDPLKFDKTFNIPPTNIITVGFKVTDSSSAGFAEFILKEFEVRYNQNSNFRILSSHPMPFTSVDSYALSWDNKSLYIAETNNLYTFDLEYGKIVNKKSVDIRGSNVINALVVSKDNNTIFAATNIGIYRIKEPMRKKIIKVTVENKNSSVPPYVVYSNVSNWKTSHSTRVIPHIINREYIYTSMSYNNEIDENIIWYPDKQYIVDGNLTIKSSKSLIILPGCNVKFKNNTSITVETEGKLIVRGGTFTSINDNTSGAVMVESTGEPEISDYTGIIALEGASLEFDQCNFKYSQNAIDKAKTAIVGITNSVFSNNEYALKAASESFYVAGHGYVYNITLDNNKFIDNKNDLYLRNFSGDINNNIFVNTSNRSIDFSDSSILELNNNNFYRCGDNDKTISVISGEFESNNNKFIKCKNTLSASNSKVTLKKNISILSGQFLYIGDNSDNKQIRVFDNKLIGGKEHFVFSDKTASNDFKAFMNYFIRTDNEIKNESSLTFDFRNNYWGNNNTKNFINTITYPFLLYGNVKQDLKLDSSNFIIHHHIRVEPGITFSLKESEPFLFSEYIKPFIDVKKFFNSSIGSILFDKVSITQNITPEAQTLQDNGFVLNTNWMGFRNFGNISLKECILDNAETLFRVYNSDEGITPGGAFDYFVYNDIKENNENLFYFDKISELATAFNFGDFNVFYNRFKSVNSKIELNPDLEIPESGNKLDLKYNYWGDNNISEDFDNGFENSVSIFPYAISENVYSSLFVSEYNNPLVVLGDIELDADIIFDLDSGEILLATDSGIKANNGSIKTTNPDNYVKISDIEELGTPYNKPYFDIIEDGSFEDGTGTKYFTHWGDIFDMLDYIGEDPDYSEYSDLTSLEIFDDENISGLSLSQNSGNIILERAIVDLDRLKNNGNETIDFKLLNSYLIVNVLGSMSIKESVDSDYLFRSNYTFDIRNSENLNSNFFSFYYRDAFTDRRNIDVITGINLQSYTEAGKLSFLENTEPLKFENNDIFKFKFVLNSNSQLSDNRFYDYTSFLINKPCGFNRNTFGIYDEENEIDNSIKRTFYDPDGIFVSGTSDDQVVFTDNTFNIKDYSSNIVTRPVGDDIDRMYLFSGNVFYLRDNVGNLFNSSSSSFKLELSNNILINDTLSEVNLFNGNFKDLSFSFNHFENDYRINVGTHFYGDSIISNNNFNGSMKVDSSILSELSIEGNYFKNTPYFSTTRLQYKVDISKSPDFDFDINTEELYGIKINNETYLTSKKEVPLTLWHKSNAKSFNFIELKQLFYDEDVPNSLFVKVNRKVNPTVGKYYVNYTATFIPTDNDSAFLMFDDASEKQKYRSSLFINHTGDNSNDNIIRGDWNDDMRVIIPINGLLGGNSVFNIPLPSDPNSMPGEPLPPADFRVVSQITPTDNGYSESYDFDGNIKLKWENNDSPSRRVFFYRLFKSSGPFTVITPPGFTTQAIVVDENTKPYIDYEITGLQPGYHGYLIKAYNSNTSPKFNTNQNNIYGDGGETERNIIVHRPPTITGPFNVDRSGGSGNVRVYCESKDGANSYKFRLSKDPFFKIGSDILEVKKSTNYLDLSDLSSIDSGVYYIQAKAGVDTINGIEYDEYTDWGPRDILFLKNKKMLGILISLDELSEIDYIERFRKMTMPANICLDDISEDVTPVFIIDRQQSVLFDESSYNLTRELYQRFIQMLSINSLDHISHVPADMVRLYEGENIDGFIMQSNYSLTNIFINRVNSANYMGGLMGVDYPARDNESTFTNIMARMGYVSVGSRYISGNNDVKYPAGRNALTSAGISSGTLWQCNFKSGNIINFPDSSNAPWTAHVLDNSNISILLEKDMGRKTFLFNKIVDSRDSAYYSDSSGNYTITDGDILARGIRYILNIAPPPPEPLNVTYYDFAAKDSSVSYSNIEYYVNSPEDENSFIVWDVDGNIPRIENGRAYPYLEWLPDKNVAYYELERISQPIANLGFTTESVFEGVLSPEFTNPSSITYVLRAFNPWGESVEKRLTINFSIPNVSIPNIEWGDSLLITSSLGGAEERSGKLHIYITKEDGDTTKESYLDPPNSFTMSSNRYSDDSRDIGNYTYYYYYTEAKEDTDMSRVFEKTDTRTDSFVVKPPSLLFDTPDYNVDSDSDGINDYYEDWDGDYIVTWVKKNPALDFDPPGQFKIYLEDKLPSGAVFGILFGANHDTFSYDMGNFSRKSTPGYHELRLWLQAFGVNSDTSYYMANIMFTPFLTEQRNKSGIFYINEYKALSFKVNAFIPRTASSSNTKMILKYRKVGATSFIEKIYDYASNGIYELNYEEIPGFSKTNYEFRCEFVKYKNGVEIDRTNRSNTLNLSFKEYVKVAIGVYGNDLGRKGKDDYANCTPYFVFYAPKHDYNFTFSAKTKTFYDKQEDTMTGEQIRNNPQNSEYSKYFNKPDGFLRVLPTSDEENEDQPLEWTIELKVEDSYGNEVASDKWVKVDDAGDSFEKTYYKEIP